MILLCGMIVNYHIVKGGHMDDTARIIAALGWPQDISQERLVASVFDRAVRGEMPIAAEMILGYVFDKREFPANKTRQDRLAAALHAIRHYAEDHGSIDDLMFDGHLVSDDVLASESWTSDSPRLSGMHGIYDAVME